MQLVVQQTCWVHVFACYLLNPFTTSAIEGCIDLAQCARQCSWYCLKKTDLLGHHPWLGMLGIESTFTALVGGGGAHVGEVPNSHTPPPTPAISPASCLLDITTLATAQTRNTFWSCCCVALPLQLIRSNQKCITNGPVKLGLLILYIVHQVALFLSRTGSRVIICIGFFLARDLQQMSGYPQASYLPARSCSCSCRMLYKCSQTSLQH